MTRASYWLAITSTDDKLGEAVARGVVASFKAGALDALPLYLVSTENRRSVAPELAGGIVKDLRIEGKSLQALVEPRTEELKSILAGPNSPPRISATIVKDYVRGADEKRFGPTLRRLAIVRPVGTGSGSSTKLLSNELYEEGEHMENDVLDLSAKGSPANYTREQWRAATLVHTGDRDSLNRSDHHIPVRTPDGKLAPKLMKAAVTALFNASFDQPTKRRAARELLDLFEQIDDNAPDSLKGMAGRVERSELSRAVENAQLAAVELAAESASDENGVLLTEKVAAYGLEHDRTYPDAFQWLRSALSGDLRRQLELERRVLDLEEELGIDFSDASEEAAIERAPERDRETTRSWLDRPREERERLIREEAEKEGYQVG